MIDGLNGDDQFTVAGNHPYDSVSIHGNNPSASDVLNFNATAAATVNLGTSTVAQAGSGAVSYSGVEVINLNAGSNALSVVATSKDDSMTVIVASATSGQINDGISLVRLGQPPQQVNAPVINYTNILGALSVDLTSGNDRLAVVGNALSQTFNINADAAPFAFPLYAATPANTVQVDDGNNLSIDGAVTYTNAEALEVAGLEGNDTFNVRPGTVPVFVDGGDPIGSTAGDLIKLFPPGAFSVEPGPENDEGGLNAAGVQRVSWDHIEAVTVIGPPGGGPALILGTNGEDEITIIARDSSTHAAGRRACRTSPPRSTTGRTYCSSTRRWFSSMPWRATTTSWCANRRPTMQCGTWM